MSKTDVKREYVFSTYVVSNQNSNDDCLVIKEILHHPDGRTKRNLRLVKNLERPFWITKPEYRTHKDKTEYCDVRLLDKYQSTQCQLKRNAFRALNGFFPTGYRQANEIFNSPYLYGADISTQALMAQEYRDRYPDVSSISTLAVMDYEWDVVRGHGNIVSGVVSFKENLHIAVTKEFLADHLNNAEEVIKAVLKKYIGDELMERNITNPIISIVNRPGDVVVELFKSVHKWSPDFLGFWNIKGDVSKILSALAAINISPESVFSDPGVPSEFKYFKWIVDAPVKVTSAGKQTPKHPADLWHTVIAPSGFYCICLMALYRHIRSRDQMLSDYKLDTVLNAHIGEGKLNFDFIPKGLPSLDWHKLMQRKYPIEYLVYMADDGIRPEKLDEKTNDVSRAVRGIIGISELARLKSNPKQLITDMHFDFLQKGKVIACTAQDMRTELDSLTPSVTGWIVTLSSELEHNTGLSIIKEYPRATTKVTTHAFDVDGIAAYPSAGVALNISKATMQYEVCGIIGLTTDETRAIGINFTHVPANALTLAETLYNYPSPDQWLEAFNN